MSLEQFFFDGPIICGPELIEDKERNPSKWRPPHIFRRLLIHVKVGDDFMATYILYIYTLGS